MPPPTSTTYLYQSLSYRQRQRQQQQQYLPLSLLLHRCDSSRDCACVLVCGCENKIAGTACQSMYSRFENVFRRHALPVVICTRNRAPGLGSKIHYMVPIVMYAEFSRGGLWDAMRDSDYKRASVASGKIFDTIYRISILNIKILHIVSKNML